MDEYEMDEYERKEYNRSPSHRTRAEGISVSTSSDSWVSSSASSFTISTTTTIPSLITPQSRYPTTGGLEMFKNQQQMSNKQQDPTNQTCDEGQELNSTGLSSTSESEMTGRETDLRPRDTISDELMIKRKQKKK